MIRHCDGQDVNLIREAECPQDCPDAGNGHHTHWKPCDCGKRFNDVYTTVIYPHREF